MNEFPSKGNKPTSFFEDYYASELDVDEAVELFDRCLERYKSYHAQWRPSRASKLAEFLSSELPPWPRRSVFHDVSIDGAQFAMPTGAERLVTLSFRGGQGAGELRGITYGGVKHFSFDSPIHGMLVAMGEIYGAGLHVGQTLHLVGRGRVDIEFQEIRDVTYW